MVVGGCMAYRSRPPYDNGAEAMLCRPARTAIAADGSRVTEPQLLCSERHTLLNLLYGYIALAREDPNLHGNHDELGSVLSC